MNTVTKLELLKYAREYLHDLPFPANRVLKASEFECVLNSLRYIYKLSISSQLILSITASFESISTMRIATGQTINKFGTDKRTEVLAILNLMIEGTVE